jgi:hypothetical protein
MGKGIIKAGPIFSGVPPLPDSVVSLLARVTFV